MLFTRLTSFDSPTRRDEAKLGSGSVIVVMLQPLLVIDVAFVATVVVVVVVVAITMPGNHRRL